MSSIFRRWAERHFNGTQDVDSTENEWDNENNVQEDLPVGTIDTDTATYVNASGAYDTDTATYVNASGAYPNIVSSDLNISLGPSDYPTMSYDGNNISIVSAVMNDYTFSIGGEDIHVSCDDSEMSIDIDTNIFEVIQNEENKVIVRRMFDRENNAS